MSFRRRMILLAAGAVAAAVVIASVVVYVATRDELRGQLDASLRQKLTPGQPQAVQVRSRQVSKAVLRREQARVSRAIDKLAKTAPFGSLGGGATAGGRVSIAPGAASTSGPARAQGAAALKASGRSPAIPPAAIHPAGEQLVQERVTSGPLPGLSLFAGDTAVLGANAAIFSSARRDSGRQATVVTVTLPAQKLGGATGYAQLVQPGGQVLRSDAVGPGLPVTARTRAVGAGKRPPYFSDATVAGTRVRMLTERAPLGAGVWQVALPLSDIDNTLRHLALVLVAVCLGGIALAAALGLLVSRAALVPVRRLTGAVERVTRTQDLSHRIEAAEADELGRLAVSFNTMLAALQRSRVAQRRLVSDASHELRTPLTSIRANLDALAGGGSLSERERARVIDAARAQLSELSVLVGDLVDLSNGGLDDAELEDVRLDLAVREALDRARLHAPKTRFVLEAEPCLVRGAPRRLDRAIANLLDNAAKWNPPSPGSPVEVRVGDGQVQVRDHGPGIADDDLPHVFDRFYRAPAARAMPGSGLGLAIVRQVAEMHGGSVRAADDPAGGARLTLELPTLRMTEAEVAADQAPKTDVQQAPQLL
jgi:two-component system, OmpR family, sensor histidine kinase MprB